MTLKDPKEVIDMRPRAPRGNGEGSHVDRQALEWDPATNMKGPQQRREDLVGLGDIDLINHLANGQHTALTVLMERYALAVFRVARWVLRNDAESEEVAQQLFLEVFRKVRQFDHRKGSVASWIKLRAYHRALDRRKHLQTNGFYQSEQLDENIEAVTGNESNVETRYLVAEILRKLNKRQRKLVEWTYFEGLTAREIADRTGESLSAIESRLSRVIAKLRMALSVPHPRPVSARNRDASE